MPDVVRSPTEQQAFLKSFGRQLERVVKTTAESSGVTSFKLKPSVKKNILDLASKYDDANSLAPIALQAAVKKIGGKMEVAGNSIRLELPEMPPKLSRT